MNVVASALARHGSPEQHGDHLTAIVAGERVATWAPLDANGEWDRGAGLTATPAGTGHRLSGVRGYVQDGQTAELILASASIDGGIAQFLVPTAAEGVTVTPLVSFDLSRRFAEISFDDAPAELLGPVDTSGVSDALDHQLQVALALLNAETAGALDAMFEMTVAYAKDRTAFGRPIGSFQALKHILADVALWVETAKAGAAELARAVQDERADAMALAHIVSAFVGDVATDIAQECLQVHGGIGYTWEHDLHLLMRRTRTNSTLYGEPTWHREQLCRIHQLGEAA
jgi:alkylation response protein AidB-like acyl-CoA dehydrogenase